MVCLTQMQGRPVVSARTGERLGRISQVLVDLTQGRIAGFRLRRGGLLDRRWRVAAMQDVTAASEAAVLLADDIALREDEPSRQHLPVARRRMTVVHPNGAPLGRLADITAELTTGALIDLLVVPDRTATGRAKRPLRIPVSHVRRCDRHAIVLEDGLAERAGQAPPVPAGGRTMIKWRRA